MLSSQRGVYKEALTVLCLCLHVIDDILKHRSSVFILVPARIVDVVVLFSSYFLFPESTQSQ